jgi:hypothetical protein
MTAAETRCFYHAIKSLPIRACIQVAIEPITISAELFNSSVAADTETRGLRRFARNSNSDPFRALEARRLTIHAVACRSLLVLACVCSSRWTVRSSLDLQS